MKHQILVLSVCLVAAVVVFPGVVVGQQVLLDAPVEAGELTLYPVLGADLEPGTDYYYVPNRARLARDARGRPEFSFLRYVENVRPGEEEETAREGEGGGIVHAVVQLDVEDSAVRAAERELGRERPGARIVGPVIYRSGTFGLVSSFLEEDGELTRRVVGLGAAPVLEGSRAAISMRLTKLGSKILWESFEMAQPDVSFVFEMEMEGLRAPLRARLEADWDRIYRHQAFQAAVAAPVLAGEVSAAFDDLRDTGAIRLVQVGADAQMEKLVAAAYDRLAKLMLEPVSGTGMPSLGQLGQGAGGGLLDRATTMLSAARAEAAARPGPPASRPATDRPAARPPGEDPPAEARDAEDARPTAEDPRGSLDTAEIERLQKEATVADLRVGYLERKAGALDAKIDALSAETDADVDRITSAIRACASEYAERIEVRLIRYAERARAEALRHRNRLAREGIEAEPSSAPGVGRLASLLTGRAGGEAELGMRRYCQTELRDLQGEDHTEDEAARIASELEGLAEGIAENVEWLANRDAEIAAARADLALTATDVEAIVADIDPGEATPEGASHVRTDAMADAEKTPVPEREIFKDEPEGREADAGANPVRDEAGGGGSGGAGGSGGGGAARSAPSVAVVAALQLRRVRQRGTFELDMSKYMAGSQPITFTQPIGDLSRYKDDETVFREINLDQPLFRQREVAFRLDGLNAEDFENYVNFVSVQLRRGEDVREELTVGAERFNERGHDFRLLYGFSGEESRDEWMQYEYRTVWSLFGGLEVEAPWTQSQDETVALPAPYVRRTIELEGSEAGLAGVPAVTVRLYYTVGEEERMTETVLRPSRGETVATADVLVPVSEGAEAGERAYGYEIIWQYGNQDSRSTGRQVTSSPVLLLDLPSP